MKGIIYKDLCLFFKGIDKGLLLLTGGILIVLVNQGVYAGMLFSVTVDLLVGILHITAFEKEAKVNWESYQRVLPVSGGKVVAGKYAVVLLTALLGMAGAAAFNLAAFAIHRTFLPETLGLSLLLVAAIPVAWMALALPICYWFGNQFAQYTGMPLGFLVFFIIKNFEDGMWAVADLTFLSGNFYSVLLIGLLALAGMFLLSFAVSTAGYCRR